MQGASTALGVETSGSSDCDSVCDAVIVGGGLAGLAAATALADRGLKVTLVEARAALGGRATSYVDRSSGETIDNCQHVSMRCCTNLSDLMSRLGLSAFFQIEKKLTFVGPSGRLTTFQADPLPAPFHLTRAFLRLPYLSLREKISFAFAVKALAKADEHDLAGKDFLSWLKEHRQTENLIDCVWDVVLVSALSESLDRVDSAYARKVFVDGFLSHADGWQVEIPSVDLDELYSVRTQEALREKRVKVCVGQRVQSLEFEKNRFKGIRLDGGEFIQAGACVLAIPQHQLANVLPQHELLNPLHEQAQKIETAPITSVHLWYDRPLTDLPHAVLTKRLGQWLFNRGERVLNGATCFYYQVVISASRNFGSKSQSAVIQELDSELQAIWPQAVPPRLVHSRMITERRAVFSVTPGIDLLRPQQQTAISNLQLAGDWTATGWPATMEGAVISGYLAAENILKAARQDGAASTTATAGVSQAVARPDSAAVVVPGLPVAWLSKILFSQIRRSRKSRA